MKIYNHDETLSTEFEMFIPEYEVGREECYIRTCFYALKSLLWMWRHPMFPHSVRCLPRLFYGMVTSFKSGGKLNMKSATAMHIKSETSLIENVGTSKIFTTGTSLTETVGTAKSSTTGTTWSHTSTGAVTIVGVPIDLNP